MGKRVVIVGTGALGSHVGLFLRNEDVELIVIDMDRVEKKNVQSQFHTVMGVGKNKTTAFAQAMQGFFGRKITTIPYELVDANVEKLLGGSMLLIDTLDNAKARKICQDYARKTKTPCLHGALAPNGAFGRVIWDEQFVIDSEAGMGAATCEDGEHLPFIGLVSSLLAGSAKAFLREGRRENYQVFPGGVVRL